MGMTLHDWIYSVYPANAAINGRYGPLHIGVMLLCVGLILAIACLRNKSDRVRYRTLLILAASIAVLEITRRVINLSKGYTDLLSLARVLLPRPWCAISCWMTMAAVATRKRLLYNFSAMISLLCALVFFAYPSVGFNHRVILFENFYSITTHSLLLVTSISMMTLGFTDFRMDKQEIKKTAAMLACVYGYAAAEILLKIEPDPLYFMPGNEVQAFLGVGYAPFLVIYAAFLAFYFSVFYLAQKGLDSHRKAQPAYTG